MKCILIRHGRTQGNIERRYSGGRTDDPLSDEGRSMLVPADIPAEYPMYFASPMARTRETASRVFPGADIHVIEEFREMDFGRFDGKCHSELDGDPDYQAWIDSGGTGQIPGGESMATFAERSMRALSKAAGMCVNEGADCLCAAVHGGSIMAIMNALTGEPYYGFYVDNGEGYMIELDVDESGSIIGAGAYEKFSSRIHDSNNCEPPISPDMYQQ